MLQHVLIILSGILVSYPIYKKRALRHSGKLGGGALLVGSAAIVFWHLPATWDAAVLAPAVHVLEHLSFFGVGLLIGSWILSLSDSAKIGALTAAFFGHMVYAVLLISPWNQHVYPLYSLADQQVLGWTLLLTGPSLIVGIAYIVARNPGWLGGFSGRSTGDRRETFIDRVQVPGWICPALTALMVVLALGYFGMTALALTGSSQSKPAGVHILIVESPVTWQYSPQRAVVVIGVNSTVTWTSDSISYDSVTSRTGSFDSGPIPPGGTFGYTFTSPGSYDYYCIYHPWMVGTIIVEG
jgi:plastocyanin